MLGRELLKRSRRYLRNMIMNNKTSAKQNNEITISFFVKVPFEKRHYKNFGIDVLIKNGFKVDVVDLTKIIYKEKIKNFVPSESIKLPCIKVPENMSQLDEYLSKIKGRAFAIVIFELTLTTFFLFKYFSKYHIPYGIVSVNSVPSVAYNTEKKDDTIKAITKLLKKGPIKIFNAITRRLDYELNARLGRVRRPDIYIVDGLNYHAKKPLPSNSSDILFVHSFDYDTYLERDRTKGRISEDHIAFLDAYLPFHPDFFMDGKRLPIIDPNRYFDALNYFFYEVEKQYKQKVVIALHPRANKEIYGKYFKGRMLEMGRTVDLVANAKAVILHHSTSINFAVLFEKPMIFITSDDIDKEGIGAFAYRFASLFNQKPVNIDHFSRDEILPSYDKCKYEEYKERYIKSKRSDEGMFWDIVSKAISKKAEKLFSANLRI